MKKVSTVVNAIKFYRCLFLVGIVEEIICALNVKKCNNELSRVRAALKDVHGVAPNNYKCPICLGNADDVKGKGNTKNGSWVIDHCHDTEKFRGWLCHKCNRSLGGFDDNILTLKRAIQYLKGTDNE